MVNGLMRAPYSKPTRTWWKRITKRPSVIDNEIARPHIHNYTYRESYAVFVVSTIPQTRLSEECKHKHAALVFLSTVYILFRISK